MVFLSKLYVNILINDHQFWSQNLDKKCPGCGVRVRRRDLKRLLFPGPGSEDPGWGKKNLITFIHQYVKAACSLHNIQYMYWPGINKEAGFRIQLFIFCLFSFSEAQFFLLREWKALVWFTLKELGKITWLKITLIWIRVVFLFLIWKLSKYSLYLYSFVWLIYFGL